MKLIASFVLCSLIYFAQGQRYIPVVMGTQWYIHDVVIGSNLEVSSKIEYLSLFDEKGTAIYDIEGNYGIIDSTGFFDSEVFSQLNQLGSGYYLANTDSGLVVMNNTSFYSCDNINPVTKSWYYIQSAGQNMYLNVQSGHTFNTNQYELINSDLFGNVAFKTKGTEDNLLVSASGHEIAEKDSKIIDYRSFSVIFDGSNSTIYSTNHKLHVPGRITVFSGSSDQVIFSDGENYIQYDLLRKREKLSLPYSKIEKTRMGYYLARKNNKYALLDSSFNELIPANYDFIRVYNDRIEVMKGSLYGLFSPDFSRELPCKFEYITYGDQFLKTKVNGLLGLVRTKDFTEILEPIFQKIIIEPTKIKGVLGKRILVIFCDKDYNVIDRVWTESSIYVQTNPYRHKERAFDPRLISQGWQRDTTNIDKWVLMTSDTTHSRFKYNIPSYIGDCRFNLIKGLTTDYKLYESNQWGVIYKLVENEKGNYLTNGVVGIDENDLLENSFLRILTTEGPAVITSDNKIRRFTYLDFGNEGPPRYCEASHAELSQTGQGIQVLLPENWNQYVNMYRNLYGKLMVTSPSWNFLAADGGDLFNEPLKNAEPFIRGTAIVQNLKGRYGVISVGNSIVPFEYSQIKRVSQYSDTVFLVRCSKSGMQYLDHQGIQTDLKGVIRKNDCFALVAKANNQFQIMDNKRNVLYEGASNIVLYDQHFLVRKNGLFVIFDRIGNEVGEMEEKPEEFYSDGLYILKDKGRLSLHNSSGLNLLNHEFRSIERRGNFFLTKEGDLTQLFNSNGELIYESKNKLFVDSVTNEYGEQLVDRFKWFSGSNNIRLKTSNVLGLNSGVLITESGVWNKQSQFTPIEDIKTVEFFPGGFTWIKGRYADKLLLRDQDLKIEGKIREIRYVGDGYLFVKSGLASNVIVHPNGEKYELEQALVIGSFSAGQLLIQDNGSYYFLNDHLEKSITQNFIDAEPFNTKYAAVETEHGWTIIDDQGKHQFFGRLDQIHQSFPGIFMYRSKYQYGLLNNNGSELIPAEYDEINILSNGMIQLWKMGDVYYTDKNGVPIDLDKDTIFTSN